METFTTLLEAVCLWCISFAILISLGWADVASALAGAGILGLIASIKISRGIRK